MPGETPRAACWLRPEQSGMVARVLSAAGVEIAAAGSPEPTQTGQVARDLACETCDDLRSALTSMDTDMVLIADPGEFGDADLDRDTGALQQARARGVPVVVLEPVPASAMIFAGTRWSDALDTGTLADLVRFAPRTRRTRCIDELHAALETFGVPRTGSISITGPHTLASLGARLFDAMDLTRALFGVPETIDACAVSPASGRGVHRVPGESLRGLSGDLTAHLRFADGRAVAMHLSDQPHTTHLGVTLLGSEGVLTAGHDGIQWRHTDGTLDPTHIERPPGDPGEQSLIAQIKHACSGVGPSHPPIDYAGVLSMIHAALLSCRTEQGESPDTIRRLMLTG